MNTHQMIKKSPGVSHGRNRRYYYQHVPRTNVLKTEAGYRFELAIPGVDKSEIAIEVDNGSLKIKHTGKANEDIQYVRKGFDFSGFQRAFELPEEVDVNQIDASFENGILMIELPVKEAAKPRTISIS